MNVSNTTLQPDQRHSEVVALPIHIKGVSISPEVAAFVRNRMRAGIWTRESVPFMFRAAGMCAVNANKVHRDFFLRERRLGRVAYFGKQLWQAVDHV